MKFTIILDFVRQLSSKTFAPKVCIVGAGPAGFYAAQQLIKVFFKFIYLDIFFKFKNKRPQNYITQI